MLSKDQHKHLLLAMHREIEDAATGLAKRLRQHKSFDISYPPNGGLTSPEAAALASLGVDEVLESAFRKIVAHAASQPLFHLFCLMDGVADPDALEDAWTGCHLAAGGVPSEQTPLHDEFFASYWEWRKHRPNPGWRLDAWEE